MTINKKIQTYNLSSFNESCAYCLKEDCNITLILYHDVEFYLCDECLLFFLRTSDAYGRPVSSSCESG